MDPIEAEALRQISKREHWDYDELPDGVDLDMLLCLDTEGLIEARASWYGLNQQAKADPDAPKTRLQHGQWYSPMASPMIGGDWSQVAGSNKRSDWLYPHQIRLSERGRAELARAQRQDAPAPRSRFDEVDTPALTEKNIRVLQTLTAFNASRLVALSDIAEVIDPPISERTIGQIVKRLIELGLAERPGGRVGGVRLTLAGRRRASENHS